MDKELIRPVYPHVIHICRKCNKCCVKENDEGLECTKQRFEPELIVKKIGGEK